MNDKSELDSPEVLLKATVMKSASPMSTVSSLQVEFESKNERLLFLDLKPAEFSASYLATLAFVELRCEEGGGEETCEPPGQRTEALRSLRRKVAELRGRRRA